MYSLGNTQVETPHWAGKLAFGLMPGRRLGEGGDQRAERAYNPESAPQYFYGVYECSAPLASSKPKQTV